MCIILLLPQRVNARSDPVGVLRAYLARIAELCEISINIIPTGRGARGNDFASASLRVIALDVCGLCACMKSRQFAGFFLRLLSGVKRLGRETKSGRSALPSIDYRYLLRNEGVHGRS